jgi:hypothetical protein
MTNHTPGPWTIESGVSNRVYLLNNAKGHAIGEIIFAETRRPADARLIAAAPELLNILQTIASSNIVMGVMHEKYRDFIRAAIAKATT